MRILFGISASVSAYKAVGMVRTLSLLGHTVDVVLSRSAQEFVGVRALEAVASGRVYAAGNHTDLARGIDVFAVVPASANIIAKFACGMADCYLSLLFLSVQCPVVLAPAMHTQMYINPATAHNIELLKSRGVLFVGPDIGKLAGGDEGVGRLAAEDAILSAVLAAGNTKTKQKSVNLPDVSTHGYEQNATKTRSLVGKNVLITAGGTREEIDPVRYIGNHSSGRQGIYFAQAAHALGARVTVICANVEREVLCLIPAGCEVHKVQSAQQLQEKCSLLQKEMDVVIMAAAVADFVPCERREMKIKKSTVGANFHLTLKKSTDILKSIVKNRPAGSSQKIVGFCLESKVQEDCNPQEGKLVRDLEKLANQKLIDKGCDFIVANYVESERGERVFGSNRNEVVVVGKSQEPLHLTEDKYFIALNVLQLIAKKM